MKARTRSVVRVAIAAVALALVTTALYAIDFPYARYLSGDFAGFWVGSHMLLVGADPYDRAAFLDMHARLGSIGPIGLPRITGYAYPLPAAILFAPFALLPIRVAAPLWLVAQLALLVVALVALGRVLFRSDLRRDLVVLIGLVGTAEPAWLLAGGGNIGGFVAADGAAIAALVIRGHGFAAGLLAGLLVVKPHPLLVALPLIALALPRRLALRAIAGAAVSAGALLAVSFALRPGWVSDYLVPLRIVATFPNHPPTLFGLVSDPAWLPFAIAGLVVALAAGWIVRMRPVPTLVVGVAIPLSLFLAVYLWSYDQLVLAVPVAVALALVADAAPATRFAVLVALALALDVLGWATYALAFQVTNESWSALVPLAVLAVVAGAAVTRRAADPALPKLEREAQRVV